LILAPDKKVEMEFTVAVEENPRDEDLTTIQSALSKDGESKAGPRNYTPLTVFLRDSVGRVVGGIHAATVWEWLHIKELWLAEDIRGRGYGTQLMKTAEQEAIARGCHHAWLDTFSFQALDFYLKRGYITFGSLEDFPRGNTRYFLKKRLV
jgi:GNAT superfamily N-acetyltransferase